MVMLCEKLGSLSHCLTMRFPSFGNSNFFSSFFGIPGLCLEAMGELEVVAVLAVVLVAEVVELGVVGSGTQNFFRKILGRESEYLRQTLYVTGSNAKAGSPVRMVFLSALDSDFKNFLLFIIQSG